jgi:glycosyltransferase involved in cell wall biosynthesis
MLEADVLIVSSRHEGGPFVLLEAALAGVPTVGTAVGHIFDWAPRAAVSVPIGDAEALARETAALLADEPRRLDIAAEAQRRAIAYDADYTAAAFERIYDELVNR